MHFLIEDRRHRRSTEPQVALRYQLEYTRERGGIEALVLADERGLVVVASGDQAICAELGAIAPLMCNTVLGMPMPPLLRGADVAVRRTEVFGQSLFLASIGGGVARDALLSHSVEGLHRILSAN